MATVKNETTQTVWVITYLQTYSDPSYCREKPWYLSFKAEERPFEELSDWQKGSGQFICQQRVELVIPDFDWKEGVITILENKKKKLTAEYMKDKLEIEDAISRLLAIEYLTKEEDE